MKNEMIVKMAKNAIKKLIESVLKNFSIIFGVYSSNIGLVILESEFLFNLHTYLNILVCIHGMSFHI